MSYFKNNIQQKIFESIMCLIAAVTLLTNSFTPQVVIAQTAERGELIESILTAMPEMATSLAEKPELKQFPIAGEREAAKTIWVVATAYSSTVDQTDSTPCITANGHNLCKQYEEQDFGNTIAANFLPTGTQVRLKDVSSDKIYVVRDRMNARYGWGRVDVWLPTREEAVEFGVKRIEMEIF